jgi:hypothetical protein
MLNQERLKELFNYDQDTGLFTRLTSARGAKSHVGDVVGCVHSKGDVIIGIKGKSYKAHRLVWLYMYGYFPDKHIDHINGNPSDNRLCNLREATQAENMQNIRYKPRGYRPGLLGTSYRKDVIKKPWTSQIVLRGRKRFLGFFETEEQAHDAYLEAKRIHHPFNTL